MGRVIAELIEIASSALKRWKSAPGEAVVIIGKGLGGETVETEMYQLSGFIGCPPKDARGVLVPISGSKRYSVIIAMQNYQLTFDMSQGETLVYSTTEDGQTLKAQIKLDADGNIDLNGDSKKLVTYGELNTALQGFKTAINAALATKLDGGGSAGTLSLDISAAETTTLRTDG